MVNSFRDGSLPSDYTLSWTPPPTGSSPILLYNIKWREVRNQILNFRNENSNFHFGKIYVNVKQMTNQQLSWLYATLPVQVLWIVSGKECPLPLWKLSGLKLGKNLLDTACKIQRHSQNNNYITENVETALNQIKRDVSHTVSWKCTWPELCLLLKCFLFLINFL